MALSHPVHSPLRTTLTAYTPRLDSRRQRMLLGLGALLIGLSVALVVVCWHIPDNLRNIFGYNPATRRLFAEGWGASPPPTWSPELMSYSFIAVWVLLIILWGGALFVISRQSSEADAPVFTIILLVAIVLNLVMVLALPPLLATDVYNYLVYGRMAVFYDLNPYGAIPSQMGPDLITGLYAWDVPTHQGPLWTLLTIGIAVPGGKTTLMPALLLFKLVAAISHIVTAVLAYRLARSIHERMALASFVFLAWNPLLLLEHAGMAHNDLTMMALALAGLLAYKRGKVWWGYGFLLASVLVKFITLLLVGFYVLAWLHQQKTWSKRFVLALKIGLVGLLVLVVSYLPFWQGLFTLTEGIAEESTHVTTSALAVLRYAIHQWGARQALSQAAVKQWEFWGIVVFPKILLALLIGRQSLRLLKRPMPHSWLQIVSAWSVTIVVYTSLLHNSLVPWYCTWTLCTAAFGWELPEQRWSAGIAQLLGCIFVLFYAVIL